MINLLIIDNYDSFTFNLDQLFGGLKGVNVDIVRNDDNFLPSLAKGLYDGVIIGPGPGSPLDEAYFGKNMQVIEKFGKKGLPILGICLGFQGIAAYFGATIKQAVLPQHGKTSLLQITNPTPLLKGVDSQIEIMRYHSLMIDMNKSFPDELVIFAETDSNSLSAKANGREIMGLAHAKYPIYGLQFHPESYAAENYGVTNGVGHIIAKNFVSIIKKS